MYAKREAIVEPVNGILKEQRGMRRFRQPGLAKVAVQPDVLVAFELAVLQLEWHP
jgi:hypothetical protein